MGLLLCSMLIASESNDVELSMLPRKIAPPKSAKAPKYCCLVFGEKAERIVWLALDGDVLSVDRDSNGEFDARIAVKKSSEGVVTTFEVGDMAIDKLDPAELTIRITKQADANAADKIAISVRIRRDGAPSAEDDGRYICYAGPSDSRGQLAFSEKIESAPIIHFGGPWSLWLQDAKWSIAKGRDIEGYLCVGTPGVGAGTFVSVGVEVGAPENATPVVKFLPGGPDVRIMHRC